MRNCKTILLRVGTTSLDFQVSSSTTINAQINSVFYNPPLQLTTSEEEISAYAIYLSSDECEQILYTDTFPNDLVPRSLADPTFSLTAIHSNLYLGQNEDYQLSFVFSTSSTDTDMALVKKISVQFPSFSTYDIRFAGTQCVGHISSEIEI